MMLFSRLHVYIVHTMLLRFTSCAWAAARHTGSKSKKKIKNIRHFGYTSPQRTSFISADIENDLRCESEVALGVCTVLYI